jgi:hypothetical protein
MSHKNLKPNRLKCTSILLLMKYCVQHYHFAGSSSISSWVWLWSKQGESEDKAWWVNQDGWGARQGRRESRVCATPNPTVPRLLLHSFRSQLRDSAKSLPSGHWATWGALHKVFLGRCSHVCMLLHRAMVARGARRTPVALLIAQGPIEQ